MLCYFHFYNNVQKIHLYHKKQLLHSTAQLNSLNRSTPEYCYQLNVKTSHSIMNIMHNRSNTLTLYPNQNSSFTIIWSEMDIWNPPVCALHTQTDITVNILTLINIGHHSARSFGLQNAYIKHSLYISAAGKSLTHSLSHTHTHTHTHELQPRTMSEVIKMPYG